MDAPDHEQFIGEPMVPARGTADPAGMARGEPGLPARFTWRGRGYRVLGVVKAWKSSGPCRSGCGEVYLRRHWYRIVTDPRAVLTVYFERQARSAKRSKARWWIYSACTGPGRAGR